MSGFIGYHTVNAALTSAFPEKRKEYPARASKLDPFKPFIDETLRADLDALRKQRHTIKRIFELTFGGQIIETGISGRPPRHTENHAGVSPAVRLSSLVPS
ncbi:hypothetical protein [Nocardia sp. NPDC002869]|uniref:hypothetical protein n=1 Tax=Nocardia sp. NPDC002869 TaxID=3161032 RepID=UPI00398CBB40